MGFSRYDKGRPFLVITQHITPAEGENTSVKNWGKIGKKNLQEMVSIEDEIKSKHLTSATVIIDIFQRRIVKSRYSEENEEVVKHYLTQYKSQVAEGIQIWMGGQYSNKEEAKTFMDELDSEIKNLQNLDDIKINVDTSNNDENLTDNLSNEVDNIDALNDITVDVITDDKK